MASSSAAPSLGSIVEAVAVTSDVIMRYKLRHDLEATLRSLFSVPRVVPQLPEQINICATRPGDIANNKARLVLGPGCTSIQSFYDSAVVWGDEQDESRGKYTFSNVVCTRRVVERDAAVYKMYLALRDAGKDVEWLKNLSVLE
jgi:hypothetical protein